MSEALENARLQLAEAQARYDAVMRDEFPPDDVKTPATEAEVYANQQIEVERIRADKEIKIAEINTESETRLRTIEMELARIAAILDDNGGDSDSDDSDGRDDSDIREIVVHHELEHAPRERAHERELTPEKVEDIAEDVAEKATLALEENMHAPTEVITGATEPIREKLEESVPRKQKHKNRFVMGRR